ERLLRPLEQGVAARQVVVGQRVVGTDLHQTLIDLQAVGETALERQQVAHDAEDIDVIGAAAEDALEEIQLEIQLVLVGHASRRLAGERGLGPFVEVLAWLRHWLSPAWSGWARKRTPSRRWTPPCESVLIITVTTRSAKDVAAPEGMKDEG